MTLDSRKLSTEELVAALAAERSKLAESAPSSAEQLIHELSVHQIEIEMQNRELRRAQIALEESRGRYADLYDLAPIGYCTFDSDGRVLEANLRAAELFGTTRQGLIGRMLTVRFAREHRTAFREHLRACLNRESCSPCELTLETGDRGQVAIELVSTPLFDADGAAIACKTTLHDISAAKTAERRLALLAEASELLSSSLDVSTMFGAVMRLAVPLIADRAVVDVVAGNELRSFAAGAAERRIRYDPSSPQAGVLRFGEPILGGRLLCFPLRARGVTLGVLSLELTGRKRLFALADRKAAQSLASRIAMALDNANLYRDARAASRAREDLLAMVSHDLKNPLQAIRLNSEFLTQVVEPLARRSVEAIQRSVGTMQGMIADLLDLARIEAGRMVLTRRDYDLGLMVGEVLDVIRPIAQAKHIEVREALPALPVRVHGDRGRVLQVLSNVVGNAVKFTDTGGTIGLEVAFADGLVRFVVRDSGVGIAPEQLPHVFDRYWQGHSARQHGSGLGLYIADGIIRAHGGEISIDSQLGLGTTVSFWVPGASMGGNEHDGDRDARILIVDDDPEIREAMSVIVASAGYEIAAAANGREALADPLAEGRRPPGLMLVDLQMPVMSGWELCAALKRDPRLGSIPIVLLSAAPDLEEEAAALGVAGYLKKPIHADALLDAIAAHCSASGCGVAPTD